VLSPRLREDFDRLGLLRLPAAVPASDVATMRERFWDFLASRHGIDRADTATWTTATPRDLQALRRSHTFDAMASEQVREALDDLLGAGGWQPPKAWGLPLVTFPVPGEPWTVPSAGWHVDSHGPEHDRPGVTVFAFLGSVRAAGGGTAVLSGSHRLFNRHIAATGTWRPADVKAALASRHPWLRDLWSGGSGEDRVARFLDREVPIDADRVCVRELTGDAGDVILMHPRTLHAPAPNARAEPRMMLVEIIGRRPDPPSTSDTG
jgi:hypothetical protein